MISEENLNRLRQEANIWKTFYVVWSGKREACDFPTKEHMRFEDACSEADRLSLKHLGTRFHVMGCSATYQAPKPEPLSKNGIIKKIKKLRTSFLDSNCIIRTDDVIEQLDKILERAK